MAGGENFDGHSEESSLQIKIHRELSSEWPTVAPMILSKISITFHSEDGVLMPSGRPDYVNNRHNIIEYKRLYTLRDRLSFSNGIMEYSFLNTIMIKGHEA